LLTDLRNYEIVLGKLLGSLLQIALFLAGTVPIFSLLLLLGGIDVRQVTQVTVVLATTALAAGSLGGMIALWRDKTFQSLALTVLCIMLYLCLVEALALVPSLLSVVSQETIQAWQIRLQPFRALMEVLNPRDIEVAFPPAYGFALTMLGLSFLLNAWAILRLRVWNPSGEPVMQREGAEKEAEEKDRAKAHAAPGPVRAVWANPILWREIATRGYGRRPLLVKAAYFLVLALIGYYALAIGDKGAWAAAYGLVPLAILSLLLVSAQAVTAITSERDIGALELLFVTDLTPGEFIFGKLLGILYNTKEFLLPPILLAVVYACRGMLASAPQGHPELLFGANVEALVCIAVGMAILMGFTMILGLHVALRTENSRLAILNTLGTVFFLSIGTLVCIYLILINGQFEYQWLSFSVFIFSGICGLWWVLSVSGTRPSSAVNLASFACPVAVFYTVTNVLIAKPGLRESTDPLIPFLVTGSAFGFTIAAMLIPLLSEFDIAIGRTSAQGE
jgi:hypothetical protein